MLQLIAIKTKEKVFISRNINNDSPTYSYNYTLDSYLFDGEKAAKTYRLDWYEVKQVPTKIELIIAPKKVNHRWELKEGFPVTDRTPKTLPYTEYDEDDLQAHFPDDYYEFFSAYNLAFDLLEETTEPVEFQINVIAELEKFEIVKQEFDLKFNLLDQLNVHPILLPTKPCKLSSVESYKIIRNYIKENINPTVACITSDYDFCLTVEKIIPLAVPEEYTIDTNFWSKKKKPKYETRYRTNRKVVVFKTAPNRPRDGVYNGYPMTEGFTGKSYEDLQNNISEYLEKLMEEINRPLRDCPHCNGLGVLEDK